MNIREGRPAAGAVPVNHNQEILKASPEKLKKA
jgi:hypothetical protein